MPNLMDDPKLTAYALGETDALTPDERAAIERELESNAALRRHVEDLHAAAGRLEAELQAEPAPGLSDAQKAALEAELKPGVKSGRKRQVTPLPVASRFERRLAAGAVAALLLVVAGLALPVLTQARRQARAVKTFAGAEDIYRRTEYDRKGVLEYSKTASVYDEIYDPSEANAPKAEYVFGDDGGIKLNDAFIFQGFPFDGIQRTTPNTESYASAKPNPFKSVRGADAVSTFSIDVDTASYANVRRYLNGGQLPPPDAVRLEELINYFPYDYAPPAAGDAHPFAAHVELATCPWNPRNRLAKVGLKGREIPWENRPSSNLVFLLDVSGSMNDRNKLPLVKQALKLLVEKLSENDRVAIAVYAGAAGLVLPSTPCHRKADVLDALDKLQAGGSTNGGQGIQLAYATAAQNFIKGGANRVILCTDGDFNVGISDKGSLIRLIEEQAKGGVFLSVLGFGMGNLKDDMLEQLADKGNGNYGYVDSEREAKKLLVEEAGGTLLTIAKDVKIQIEFNPAVVDAYRLLGYENRVLAREDFNDDKKDAGEIGAGHTVTALYEIVPKGRYAELVGADPLKYQEEGALTSDAHHGEMFTLKLRYKQPEGETSTLMTQAVTDPELGFEKASKDFRFAAAVAYFGMILRDSPYRGSGNWELARELASEAKGDDPKGYRNEFVGLIERASALDPKSNP
ncbi:MAG: von Willebrand factor type A domain-containing protein [Planctomycetota bacterium]|nr:von Willebrand factor type A domain-containing protein [Planctomycetota bacterium]